MIKKTLLGIAFLFLFSNFFILAQKFNFGVKAGIDFVNFRSTGDWKFVRTDIRSSYDFGFAVNYTVFKYLQLQIEPGFVEKGAQVFSKTEGHLIFKHGYITSPFLLIIKPVNFFNIEAGPEFGYLIYSKWIDFPFSYQYEFKKFELCGTMGLGIKPIDNISLTFRYTKSFSYLFETMAYIDPGPPAVVFGHTYNDCYSIGIRYFFGKEIKTNFKPPKRINTCIETVDKQKKK